MQKASVNDTVKNVLWNSSLEFLNKTCTNGTIWPFWTQGYGTLLGPVCGYRVKAPKVSKIMYTMYIHILDMMFQYNFLRLSEPISQLQQVGSTNVAYRCVQNDKIFWLIQVSFQNSCEEFHRTLAYGRLALAFEFY